MKDAGCGEILKGKVAMVTGARRGIGRATVEEFASLGADVWACARCEDAELESWLGELSETYGVFAAPAYFDLTESVETRRAIQAIKRGSSGIDVLVNCAGIVSESSSFAMTRRESVLGVVDVNLARQMEVTQYALRIMRDGGSIVNISSIAATGGMPGQYGYACSKAAVEVWTRMLAQELRPRGIRANAVAPGFVDTDMGNQAAGSLIEEIVGSTIAGRMARPEEIARVIAFLASDLSSYIIGQTIVADGGYR